jgi:hypothetical protein
MEVTKFPAQLNSNINEIECNFVVGNFIVLPPPPLFHHLIVYMKIFGKNT